MNTCIEISIKLFVIFVCLIITSFSAKALNVKQIDTASGIKCGWLKTIRTQLLPLNSPSAAVRIKIRLKKMAWYTYFLDFWMKGPVNSLKKSFKKN